MGRIAAVVLAGGRGTRFGGVDKPGAAVAGVPMLVRVLAAAAGCAPRIVVGPPREGLPVDVRFVREEPPGGGPVAALAAALPFVDTELVVLLAGDLPFLTVAAVEALIAAVVEPPGGDEVGQTSRDAAVAQMSGSAEEFRGAQGVEAARKGGGAARADGALLVDGEGRRQVLCGVWRVDALRGALGRLGEPAGQSVRRLIGALGVVEVRLGGGVWLDVDTPEDLERAERAMMADDGSDDLRGTGARGLDQ